LASKLDNLPSLKAADIAELRSLCWFAGFADKLDFASRKAFADKRRQGRHGRDCG